MALNPTEQSSPFFWETRCYSSPQKTLRIPVVFNFSNHQRTNQVWKMPIFGRDYCRFDTYRLPLVHL